MYCLHNFISEPSETECITFATESECSERDHEAAVAVTTSDVQTVASTDIHVGCEPSTSSTNTANIAECDIGKLLHLGIDIHHLDREEKYRILKREPNPHSSAYPHTRPYNSGPFRQFQPSWLLQYPWLHYSPFCDGAFCRACALFAPDRAGGQVMGQFVTKPFKSWANQSQKMTNHGSLAYHLTACTKMQEFLATYKEPSKAINTQLDSQAQKQLEENHIVILSLLKVTMLLGKQDSVGIGMIKFC